MSGAMAKCWLWWPRIAVACAAVIGQAAAMPAAPANPLAMPAECQPSPPEPSRHRPGQPDADQPATAPCDPTRLPPPQADQLPAPQAAPNRWRVVDSLGHPANLANPYTANNILKADRPAFGTDWFF